MAIQHLHVNSIIIVVSNNLVLRKVDPDSDFDLKLVYIKVRKRNLGKFDGISTHSNLNKSDREKSRKSIQLIRSFQYVETELTTH